MRALSWFGHALLWAAHYAYWLKVHRGNFGNARFATDHEMGAWNK